MVKEMTSSLTVAGGLTIDRALIHRLVVEPFNLGVKGRINLRLQDGGPIEDNGEIEESPWF
jgi:hypothetical protein